MILRAAISAAGLFLAATHARAADADWRSVRDFGARCDGQTVLSRPQGGAGLTVAAGAEIAEVGRGQFTPADVGKVIQIGSDAFGRAPFATTIAGVVDETHIRLARAPDHAYRAERYTYGTDDTAAWRAAGQSPHHGARFTIPAGTCLVRTWELGDGQTWEGAGDGATVLFAIGSDARNLITLPIGPLQKVHLRGFALQGAGRLNPRQSALYFHAKASPQPPFHGGPWHFTLDDITIRNFDGSCLVLRGEPTLRFLLPVQWLSIRDLDCEHADNAYSRGLLATGQVQHVHIDSSRFDGQRRGGGINIELGREFEAGGAYGGAFGGGKPLGPVSPGPAITFTNLTCQLADTCLYADATQNITLTGAYLEQLYRGMTLVNGARGFLCLNCAWLNSAADGKGGGYALSAGAGTDATLIAPQFNAKVTDKLVVNAPGSYGVTIIDPNIQGDVRRSGEAGRYFVGMRAPPEQLK